MKKIKQNRLSCKTLAFYSWLKKLARVSIVKKMQSQMLKSLLKLLGNYIQTYTKQTLFQINNLLLSYFLLRKKYFARPWNGVAVQGGEGERSTLKTLYKIVYSCQLLFAFGVENCRQCYKVNAKKLE